MSPTITHPRPQPGRQNALGIEFRDGVAQVAELHPERELALRQHGFEVERDLAPKRTRRKRG